MYARLGWDGAGDPPYVDCDGAGSSPFVWFDGAGSGSRCGFIATDDVGDVIDN